MSSDDGPVPFGFKCSWLAIRDVAPEKIIAALPVRGARPSGWAEGVETAYEGGVFVTPPIGRWVLVASTDLPDFGDAEHPDQITALIVRLSRELETGVQYFGTHRVVEYHAWAWGEHGEVLRAYAYIGESGTTITDVGTKTAPEEGFELFDERSPEAADDGYWEREDLRHATEELVMEIAGAWSVDPTTIDEQPIAGRGWVGSR
jgi:hypothetical protein